MTKLVLVFYSGKKAKRIYYSGDQMSEAKAAFKNISLRYNNVSLMMIDTDNHASWKVLSSKWEQDYSDN